MEEEFKKLLKEQKEERQKLKKELSIKKIIQDKTLMPFRIYINSLYGRDADITFKKEEGVNKEELLKLLKLFKPINMFLIGGNSFRFSKDNLKEYEKDNIKEVLPYTISYRSLEGYNPHIEINWFSKQDNFVFGINAIIKDYSFINEFCSVSAERQEFKGGFRYTNTFLNLNGNFADENFKFIKWGRGTEQQKNDFTIYTEKTDLNFIEYIKI